MGDIAILEVALRNHMDRQLSLIALEQAGTEDWYMAGLRFDDRTQRQIREAWGHLTIQQKKWHTHGHLLAALTFGFWRNLLENGGAIHARWPDEGSADYERTTSGAKASSSPSLAAVGTQRTRTPSGQETTR